MKSWIWLKLCFYHIALLLHQTLLSVTTRGRYSAKKKKGKPKDASFQLRVCCFFGLFVYLFVCFKQLERFFSQMWMLWQVTGYHHSTGVSSDIKGRQVWFRDLCCVQEPAVYVSVRSFWKWAGSYSYITSFDMTFSYDPTKDFFVSSFFVFFLFILILISLFVARSMSARKLGDVCCGLYLILSKCFVSFCLMFHMNLTILEALHIWQDIF